MKKVALVTGASSGIGMLTARELAERGFMVYAAARRLEKMDELKEYGVKTVFLDLTDETSIKNCVHSILDESSRIDVLVNNAGYGSYGAVEDVPIEEAKRQFDVNVFGMARLIQLVVPSMRQNHYGKIINVSSVAGKIWTKFGDWYHATKFAVEGLSNCLRVELKPFGIDVVIVEPGCINTNWVNIAMDKLRETSKGGAYEERANKSADFFMKIYARSAVSEPELIAKTIIKAATKNNPRPRYLVGYMTKPLVLIHTILRDRGYDWALNKFS